MTMFGTFLISRGVVTSTEVVRALDVQRAQRLPLASIAMKRGILDAHQALRTMDEEKKSRRDFAECAVGLGFATREQMQSVEADSERSGPLLGEVLITLGYMNRADLDREIQAFQRFSMATPRFGVPRSSATSLSRRHDERGDGIIELARHRAGGVK